MTGCLSLLSAQSVGIGTTAPHPSARLDVVDNQRGILIPRMTTAERDAITNPARSLLIYNIDCDVYQYYVPGTGWVTITHSGISGGGGGGGSITALPPTGVGPSGYTAHWTPVVGATGYTIKTYSGCSGANPTLVNTTTVSGGTTSSAFVWVSIPCNSDMCYEVLATVTTGTACGSSTTQIVSNRAPISQPTTCTTPNTWLQISAGPIAPPGRDNYVAIAHGGYIYVGFGLSSSLSCLNDWWRWDPCTGNWQALASPPTTIGALPFIFSIGNYIYVGGGGFGCGSGNSEVYRYDPGSNSWTPVAPLPLGRHGAVGTSDGTYGYVACGQLSGGQTTDEILRYDPTTDTWTVLTNYPAGEAWIPFMAYHAGRLWIGTGQSSSCKSEFYSYDLATNTWTQRANYPLQSYDEWAVAYNGRIYVTGGHFSCSFNCTTTFYYYNIATNTWNAMPNFPGGNRNNLYLAELNGVLYGGLGHDCYYSYPLDWWAYCP